MHITIAPASPKTGRATVRALLDSLPSTSEDGTPVRVTGIYRNLDKVPKEFLADPRFRAVQGDVEDAASLDFSDTDALLTITPPFYLSRSAQAVLEGAKQVSLNVKDAIVRAEGRVRRVVLVSSMGAQYENGTGEIKTNHIAEGVFRDSAPEVVFVRCGYFMENWASAVETIKRDGSFHTTIVPLDMKVAMIATLDIGTTCASCLTTTTEVGPGKSPLIFDLEGPELYSSLDVQAAFQEVSGKPEVTMVTVDKDEIFGYYSAVLPPDTAEMMTEMNFSFLPGGIMYENSQPSPGGTKRGKVTLVEAFKALYEGSEI